MFIEIHDDEPDTFNAYHMPALEQHEARNNLILSFMLKPSSDPANPTRRWTIVGEPGACAIQTSLDRSIILGELNEAQCHMLAEFVGDCPGVVGPEEESQWFVGRARELGMAFKEPLAFRIYAISTPPLKSDSSGSARRATPAELDLFAEWTNAFMDEALPDDKRPTREEMEADLTSGKIMFWEVDGKPVSMAGIYGITRSSARIGAVYTPREFRQKGYAGSVTAATVERIFAEGKTLVCLYTDTRNPFSSRCYEKIGFKPICEAWHYYRTSSRPQSL